MSSLDRYDPNAQNRLVPSTGPAAEFPEAPLTEPEVRDLRDILAVIWRYKLLILFVFAACVLIAAFVTSKQIPIYQATAKILVDTGPTQPISSEGFGAISEMLGAGRSRSIQTQVEVLQSYPILESAYKLLGKKLNPDRPPSVRAQNIRDTDIIKVVVEDPDKHFAASLANAITSAYISRSQAANRRAATNTKEFLRGALEKQRRALADAENRLKAYKEKTGVASITDEVTNRMKRLAAAEEELATAETQVRSLQGQLRAVEDMLSKAEQTYVRETVSSSNPLVSAMRDKIASLEIQRAALLKEYQPDTPEVQAIDDQIAKARETLQQELRREMISSSQAIAANPVRLDLIQQAGKLRAELEAQKARVLAIRPIVEKERLAVSELPSRERGILALAREVANLERVYGELNSKYQEVSVAEQAKLASASLLEPARVPRKPIKPRPILNLFLAAVIGLIVGLMLAFLLDHLDDTIKGTEDVDRNVGLPTLGAIPALPKSSGPIIMSSSDRSVMAESFRLLRSNIRFASPDRPLKSIMITSPGAGEGKTTTAVNLAIALATNGLKVILADMDLRKPSVGKTFGLKRDRGLTNVVLGDLPIEEALQDTKVENLRVLLGGPLPPNPPEFLDSERCRAVINQLKQMADFLVIDTPPASFLTDGMILASQVDGVLVVANPRRTTRHALRRVVEQLLLAKGNILGVCLNRMQPGGREGYYYYYSYYYGYYHYYGDNGAKRGSKKSDAKGIKGFLKRLPGLAGKEARSGSEPSEQTESGGDSS